jgi:hypothetical protein
MQERSKTKEYCPFLKIARPGQIPLVVCEANFRVRMQNKIPRAAEHCAMQNEGYTNSYCELVRPLPATNAILPAFRSEIAGSNGV